MSYLRYRNVNAVVLSYTSFDSGVKGPREKKGSHALANVRERFGQQLKKLRLQQNVSQERLAELAGLHRTYVSGVERGQHNISLENIEKLALALNVPMGKLMP